jgi:hypothetical protein
MWYVFYRFWLFVTCFAIVVAISAQHLARIISRRTDPIIAEFRGLLYLIRGTQGVNMLP